MVKLPIFYGLLLLIFSYTAECSTLRNNNTCECTNIDLNARKLILQYYKKGSIDSITMVLELWEEKCGRENVNNQLLILNGILHNSFFDTLIDVAFFESARYNQSNSTRWRRYYNKYYSNDHIKYYEDFDSSIIPIFDSIAKTSDTTSTEHLLSLYYSKKYDLFYRRLLQDTSFNHSKLKKLIAGYSDILIRKPAIKYKKGTKCSTSQNSLQPVMTLSL